VSDTTPRIFELRNGLLMIPGVHNVTMHHFLEPLPFHDALVPLTTRSLAAHYRLLAAHLDMYEPKGEP
jgi:hypothetical protein